MCIIVMFYQLFGLIHIHFGWREGEHINFWLNYSFKHDSRMHISHTLALKQLLCGVSCGMNLSTLNDSLSLYAPVQVTQTGARATLAPHANIKLPRLNIMTHTSNHEKYKTHIMSKHAFAYAGYLYNINNSNAACMHL